MTELTKKNAIDIRKRFQDAIEFGNKQQAEIDARGYITFVHNEAQRQRFIEAGASPDRVCVMKSLPTTCPDPAWKRSDDQ